MTKRKPTRQPPAPPDADPPEVIWARQAQRRRALGVQAIRAELAEREVAELVTELELHTEVDPDTGAPVAWVWTVRLDGLDPLIWRHDNRRGALPVAVAKGDSPR